MDNIIQRETEIRTLLCMGETDLCEVIITPEVARKILNEHNSNNRKLSNRFVEQYTKDIIEDRWKKSNDNITFDDNWELSNGQHRLKAVTIANKPVKMVVQFHVNQNCEIDRGKQRTIAENIKMSNLVDNEDLRADGKVIALVNTAMRTMGYERVYRTKDVVDMINKYEHEILNVRAAGLMRGSDGVSQMAIASSLFVAYINGVEMEILTRIRRVLNSGMVENGDKDKPIIGLRDRLMNIRGGGEGVNLERAKYTQYCIKAILAGKATKMCKCNELYYRIS